MKRHALLRHAVLTVFCALILDALVDVFALQFGVKLPRPAFLWMLSGNAVALAAFLIATLIDDHLNIHSWLDNPLGWPKCERCGKDQPCDCVATINQSIQARIEDEESDGKK